ncbi:hypothetical protein N7491_004453 [Penicillium cf. griseofulvum]|uniref:BZIP domain-containing protein n=1 Tax=Penicillium cf. griseofulvum TaxID=2972120 RepID=A0A9W9IZY4_9EURO|nr:hypothetical protein N7472_007142 [Penicillium cf. griseofulvum]KAJ5422925.1 hypothetical protein N7445_011033 [Penicillium cf. griseofulvum]KAJ5433858.1 hypothetical protein N7491_004453 [Penicillium cf. griseofulvum]
MDQQLLPQPSGGLPLSGYEDKQHGALLFSQNRPFVPHSATSNIASLLPISSCPQTEVSISQGTQMHEQLPLSGDVFLENRSSQNRKKQTIPSQSKTQKSQKRQRYKPKPAVVKKRGEPRDAEIPLSGVPEDRRRMQVRLAQRAFRSRQRDAITGLNNRISQLETILDRMSLTVLSFSGQLIQSGVLAPYSDLTTHLHDTIKTFHALTSEANPDRETPVSNAPSHSEDLPQSSSPGLITTPSSNIPPSSSPDRSTSDHFTSDSFPHTLESPEISVIELSEFIERLNLACLYQGKLALCDQSISLHRLQTPFGFLFSMMNRECATVYFKARLDAQVSQKPLDGWAEVPFFGLGGAGTHYPRLSLHNQGVSHSFRGYHEWDIVRDPLSLVSPDIQEQLKGDWFDLQDLEGFLREKDVILILCSDEPNQVSPSKTTVNIARLIPALMTRGICLGRTPGFHRDDVEKALQHAKVP